MSNIELLRKEDPVLSHNVENGTEDGERFINQFRHAGGNISAQKSFETNECAAHLDEKMRYQAGFFICTTTGVIVAKIPSVVEKYSTGGKKYIGE